MRVIFDANVLLSFLLTPDEQGVLSWVVRTALDAPDITVIVPVELLRETIETARLKPYFQAKVSQAQLWDFLERLGTHTVTPPLWQGATPRYSRDPKDDYLLVYGLELDVDYLVTGDRDLLVLGQVVKMALVSPVVFAKILMEQGRV